MLLTLDIENTPYRIRYQRATFDESLKTLTEEEIETIKAEGKWL